jgi:nitronate monooxygenase
MNRTLLAQLGIELPIIQAPMAGVSTPAMAAAVSNAGGLGSLGVGATNADGARRMIHATRKLTSRPFNINLFAHPPARPDRVREQAWMRWLAPQFEAFSAAPPMALREIYLSFTADEAMLAMLLEERPAVVSLHFGLPHPPALAALKRAGIVLLATATSLPEAALIADAGIDAVVAQGIEAGGHRGMFDTQAPDEELSTLALTRLLVNNTSLPVIAAGGIMDGAGIAAALSLGAQAAQLGTAFAGTPESAIDPGYRHALFDATRTTVLTDSISGRKARCLCNRFTALDADGMRPPAPPDYPVAYDAGKRLHEAAKAKGEFGFGAQWAGQAFALARALPAGALVRVLARELEAAE